MIHELEQKYIEDDVYYMNKMPWIFKCCARFYFTMQMVQQLALKHIGKVFKILSLCSHLEIEIDLR